MAVVATTILGLSDALLQRGPMPSRKGLFAAAVGGVHDHLGLGLDLMPSYNGAQCHARTRGVVKGQSLAASVHTFTTTACSC